MVPPPKGKAKIPSSSSFEMYSFTLFGSLSSNTTILVSTGNTFLIELDSFSLDSSCFAPEWSSLILKKLF